MTFEQWTKSLGYALTENELYRMRQAWEAAMKEFAKNATEDENNRLRNTFHRP